MMEIGLFTAMFVSKRPRPVSDLHSFPAKSNLCALCMCDFREFVFNDSEF